MSLTGEKEDLLTGERRVGLLRKWLVYGLGILFLRLLYPAEFAAFNLKLFLAFGLLYAVYSLYVLTIARGPAFHALWYLFYLVELAFVSILIFYSNGMDSLLFIFYPMVLIGIALVGTTIVDFAVSGLLGHFSYVATLLIYYGSLAFYLTPFFWVQCLSAGAIFAFGMAMVRYVRGKNTSAREMAVKMEEMAATAKQLSITDDLTGLYNERYFRERLHEEIKRAERYGTPLALLVIDVDYFETYNDAYGRPARDVLLRQLSAMLRQFTRETDVACRYSGDGFALLLPHTTGEGGLKLAERLRKAVEAHPFAGKKSQPGGVVSVCIGVASYPANAGDADELLLKAEKALAQAKEGKKNRTRPYLSLIVGSREQASRQVN